MVVWFYGFLIEDLRVPSGYFFSFLETNPRLKSFKYVFINKIIPKMKF